MNKSLRYILLSSMAACAMYASAKVSLASVICDSMVVQYDQPFQVWGTAEPSEQISLNLAVGKKKQKATATADSLGRWSAQFKPVGAGKECTLTVGDQVVNGIIGGEVFLCSGQSNMELPVRRVTDMFAEEIAAYTNPNIRQFVVPKEYEFAGPASEMGAAKWVSVTPRQAMEFSALAYFFAKARNAATGMPVGIVNSSWGGTPIEAWVSADSLADFPHLMADYHNYKSDAYRKNIKALENKNFAAWNAVLDSSDPGLTGPTKWMAETLDDSEWESVDLLDGKFGYNGKNPMNGSHWFRKTFTLPDDYDGSEAVLRLGCVVDADSAFVNGKKVGFTSYQYPPRIYNVPAGVLHPGKNVVVVRLISQNGAPHFVAEKPYKLIIGDDEVDLSGQWRYHAGARMPQAPGMQFYHYYPTVLYNKMIAPLQGLAFQGVVWYQGESNVGRRHEYAQLLKAMIGNWRELFGDDDLPFYVVELADFLHPSDVNGRKAWAEMRQEQLRGTQLTHDAYLIHNSDLGEWNDIHPLDKKTIGQRVADAVK